jgi:SAM-dependent methyltransferase
VLYGTRDVLRRRQLVHDALGAAPGERILDVGCGPGFYVAELLERVGSDGSVVGIDSSQPMLKVAAHRSEGHNVEFHEADATSLPVENASFDAALSVQVLEYVAEVPAALAEIFRALRAGGRLVVWDVDWATVSLHTTDPARTGRVLRSWGRAPRASIAATDAHGATSGPAPKLPSPESWLPLLLRKWLQSTPPLGLRTSPKPLPILGPRIDTASATDCGDRVCRCPRPSARTSRVKPGGDIDFHSA